MYTWWINTTKYTQNTKVDRFVYIKITPCTNNLYNAKLNEFAVHSGILIVRGGPLFVDFVVDLIKHTVKSSLFVGTNVRGFRGYLLSSNFHVQEFKTYIQAFVQYLLKLSRTCNQRNYVPIMNLINILLHANIDPRVKMIPEHYVRFLS